MNKSTRDDIILETYPFCQQLAARFCQKFRTDGQSQQDIAQTLVMGAIDRVDKLGDFNISEATKLARHAVRCDYRDMARKSIRRSQSEGGVSQSLGDVSPEEVPDCRAAEPTEQFELSEDMESVLTRREIGMVHLLTMGYTQEEIAKEYGINQGNVARVLHLVAKKVSEI